jgi:hypothetical protein
MRRALIWLNPYGHEAGGHKLKNGLKAKKMHFLPILSLRRPASWPYGLSQINALVMVDPGLLGDVRQGQLYL